MAIVRASTPLSPEMINGLAVGDTLRISGRIITGRDKVHKYLASGGKSPVELEGAVIYHCGPVAAGKDDTWRITAAGPTTSMREEPYQADIIRTFRPGAIMGKGGMGENSLAAMASCGCVYLHLTGGAAQFYASRITVVEEVHLREFGQVEAMWVLRVQDLPALVTMDSHGRSLHAAIESNSLKRFRQLLESPL